MPFTGEVKRMYNRKYVETHPDKLRAMRRSAILRRAMRSGRLPTTHSIRVHGISDEELVYIMEEALRKRRAAQTQ